jgi:hypothetical protein
MVPLSQSFFMCSVIDIAVFEYETHIPAIIFHCLEAGRLKRLPLGVNIDSGHNSKASQSWASLRLTILPLPAWCKQRLDGKRQGNSCAMEEYLKLEFENSKWCAKIFTSSEIWQLFRFLTVHLQALLKWHNNWRKFFFPGAIENLEPSRWALRVCVFRPP